jgi:hypothetical protein
VDAFWTDDELAFRRKAADYFSRKTDPCAPSAAAIPAEIWRDLGGVPGADGAAASICDGLSARVSIFDEAACHDPRLGRDLFAWRAASGAIDPHEDRLCRLGWLAGTATHVLKAGARAARDQGAFSSSLMGCREVQESLARLVAGADLVRLGTCRLCRLLEKGDRVRADRESDRLHAAAAALACDLRSVALSLLGASWVEANLSTDDPPSDDERICP